ncbi:acyltransferase family protein [Bacteroides sp. 224]|uniref:acyltransferase family protein n=1 Tax=Bacteroides sp. 224 TaxID=2302936 RepID=UPI0013CF4F7C|nr:DUF5009 domain-containing protein [Bacteroides sp. 224]NDV64172.1 DUF5009 domain-containing protein [Bacteroides sp. 224]
MNTPIKQRLLSLDILRGITIAGMILVNNPGNWGHVYAPLRHVKWNGLTPTDLVFPFFMFIMGISTYISLKKYNFQYSHTVAWKIIKRTLVIFAIGLGIAWFYLILQGKGFSEQFEQIRILGVMQRLALCYGVTALIALTVKHKYIPALIAFLLIGYLLILLLGKGFEYNETNILSIVDRYILGANHMYKDNSIDPEGLLSTVSAIAHVLIGFYCGKLLLEAKNLNEKMLQLFIIGTTFTFIGFLLSYGCPINKKIWSPSFVIITCGLAASLLALLIWIIDCKGLKGWTSFFRVFGVNPLFMYVFAAFLSLLFGYIRIPYEDTAISLHGYIYNLIVQVISDKYLSSLIYALLFVTLNWFVGYWLYKKNIYIKI